MEGRILFGLALGIVVGCSWTCHAASVSIAPDRMLVVDGKRTFVLGLYENPSDDGVLKQVAGAGFNLVHAPAEPAALDRLHQHGLHAWINIGGAIDLSQDRAQREEQLRGSVASYSPHPALLVWEVPDEALWNCWYGPLKWRTDDEPAQQRAKIDALNDKALAEQLRAQQAEAHRLFARADFAGCDRLAEAIWRKLGVEPPAPGLKLSDAAQAAERMCAGMRDGYALLRRLDPQHPVWMNHAPRNQRDQLAAFNAAADIAGCDIYPVPAYQCGHSGVPDRSLAAVGAYTTLMQDAAPRKPIWMVLQGFAWSALDKNPTEESIAKSPCPKPDESRFMAYDAIVRGARGILYWGTFTVKKDAAFWADLLKLVRELADLEPVLAARDASAQPKVEIAPTWGSGGWDVKALAKDVGGKKWFLVVNENSEPLQYTLRGLKGLNGIVYRDERDTREATVRKGRLTLGIGGHGVQILQPGGGR